MLASQQADHDGGKNDKVYVLRLKLGIAVIGFLALLVFAVARFKTSGSADNISKQLVGFDPPFFYFGTALQAQTIPHDFRLVNRSTNELRIVAMKSSCSCTMVADEVLGRVLRPNEECMIPVTFETGSRHGHSDSTIDVILEASGLRYIAKAMLSGEVTADFAYTPRAVDFGTLRPGETATQEVFLKPKPYRA